MGIRFYCPSGHRLNVKDFLAGKTGICPHCAARFVIPLASELPEGAPKIKPGSAAAGGAPSDREMAPDEQEAPVKQESPEADSLSARAPRGVPTAVAAALNAGALAKSTPVRPTESAGVSVRPTAGSSTVFAASPALWPEPAPVVREAGRDPIDEIPDAVWYVRPPSGGQYGPAKGDVLRQWMQEGRVAADSLVWREGWIDWQLAGPVFPELESAYIGRPGPAASRDLVDPRVAARPAGSSTQLAPGLSAPGLSAPGLSAPGLARSRPSARSKPLAAVIVLTLLVVVLVVGLVIVLSTKPS